MTTKNSLIYFIALLLFTIFSCQKEKLCGEYACQNDGECVNNECRCTIGYMGEYCEQEKVPTSMQISLIKVTDFPETENSGTAGYSDPVPDIYVKIFYNNSAVYTHPTNYSEAKRGEDYEFKPSSNIVLLHPTKGYYMILMDKDDEADDLVAEQLFVPYQPGLGFPNTIRIGEEGDFSFELEVQYAF